MRSVASRFVGGPWDGRVHPTPGAAWHVVPVAIPVTMTSERMLEIMATHPDDRKPDPVAKAFYRRRPEFEHCQFVYDYDRTER